MAAGSFVLVPIVDELSMRGYPLARLPEDYGDAGALVLSAVFFTLVHLQYFAAEILSLGMLASLLVASLASGYVLIRTGSLVPPILAHALQNLPLPPGEWSQELLLLLALGVVVFAWRPIGRWARGLAALLRSGLAGSGTLFGLAVLVAGLGLVLALQDQLTAIALVFLALGIGVDALGRRAS